MLAAIDTYRAALSACNDRAPENIAGEPEFRRLMDSALASLSALRDWVVKKDPARIHSYLIELRSTDRLLYLRYG